MGFRSLQAQLALRLGTVFLVATVIGVGALVYEGMGAADSLGQEQLVQRARELARYVAVDPDGTPHVDLPPALLRTFGSPNHTDIYAVRGADGHLIGASDPALSPFVPRPTADTVESRPLRLENFGTTGQDYYALIMTTESDAGPLAVLVGRPSDADALARALLRQFVLDIAWTIPLFAAASLAVGIWSIRRGLAPVRLASERAASITPGHGGVRLPVRSLPTELVPLAAAVNSALDRLEQGFSVQRQFTANAAHELRTPLAILTAGLETLEDSQEDVARLRDDAARMNRLVDQLLRVARLDAMPMDTSKIVDLAGTAASCVEYLAPWAIQQGKKIGFEGPETVVRVRGDADALNDALRNLVENAVVHTPIGTEVAVTVSSSGSVSVSDSGPGVRPDDKPYVFDRFWRGKGECNPGAGLGLAIVAEIARAHSGMVEVGESPEGGAKFTITLPTVAAH